MIANKMRNLASKGGGGQRGEKGERGGWGEGTSVPDDDGAAEAEEAIPATREPGEQVAAFGKGVEHGVPPLPNPGCRRVH